jgi:hypothetical protein
MKRIVSLMLTTAALGFIPAAFAGQTGPGVAQTQAPNTRLAALVPAGMSAQDACNGFKDVTECSAALHAAQNLNIPFSDLKGKVTAGQSLTSAIHALKPAADARTEVRKAEKQAREDLASPQG